MAKHLARHINYALYLCKYLGKFIEYIDNIDIDDITYLNLPVKRYKTFSVYFSLVQCQGTEFNSPRCCICMGDCRQPPGHRLKMFRKRKYINTKIFVHIDELQTSLVDPSRKLVLYDQPSSTSTYTCTPLFIYSTQPCTGTVSKLALYLH